MGKNVSLMCHLSSKELAASDASGQKLVVPPPICSRNSGGHHRRLSLVLPVGPRALQQHLPRVHHLTLGHGITQPTWQHWLTKDLTEFIYLSAFFFSLRFILIYSYHFIPLNIWYDCSDWRLPSILCDLGAKMCQRAAAAKRTQEVLLPPQLGCYLWQLWLQWLQRLQRIRLQQKHIEVDVNDVVDVGVRKVRHSHWNLHG